MLARSQARIPKAPIEKAPTATKRSIGARSARGNEEVRSIKTRAMSANHLNRDPSNPGCFSKLGERREVYQASPVDRFPGGLKFNSTTLTCN